MRRWQPREGEKLLAGLFQAVGNGATLEPPFADERLASRRDLLGAACVDHVGEVRRNLFRKPLWCMRDQVTQLMHRAALNEQIRPQAPERLLEPRLAIHDRQLRPLQAAFVKVIEPRAPRRLALAAHVAHRQQNLLPVGTHTQDNQ